MNPYKEILRKFFSEYVSALRKRRGLHRSRWRRSFASPDGHKRFGARHILLFPVALVFLLLMLEEGEIKELLSPLRDEIEKVEDREVA